MSGLARRIKSGRFKRKLDQLLESPSAKFLEDHGPSYVGSEVGSVALLAAIEARVWSLMQTEMIKSRPCQALRRMSAPKKTGHSRLESQGMLEGSFVDVGDDMEPLFDYSDCEPVLKTQDLTIDEELLFGRGLFDDGDHLEKAALEEDLFWEAEAAVDDQAVDENLFWKELDLEEDILDHSQATSQGFYQHGDLIDSHHELLDDMTEDLLDSHAPVVSDDIIAGYCF